MQTQPPHAPSARLACAALVLVTPAAAVNGTAALASRTQDAAAAQATPLTPGQPVARDIAPGQRHEYTAALAKGQVLELVVEQRGVDVVVSVLAPDGARLADFDSPNGAEGPEPVFLLAEAAGAYRVVVAPFEPGATAGKYEVGGVRVRPATAEELERAKVEREILQVEQAWDDAHTKPVLEEIARLMAPDYTAFSVSNRILNQTRAAHMATMEGFAKARVEQGATVRNEIDDRTVRVFGDTAVVTGRIMQISTSKLQTTRAPFRFMHIWQKRNGTWQIVGDQFFPADPVPKQYSAVQVDPAVFDAYVGTYRDDTGFRYTVAKAGDHLLLDTGDAKIELYPASDSVFFMKGQDVQLTFVRNAQGRVTHADLRQAGRSSSAQRIE